MRVLIYSFCFLPICLACAAATTVDEPLGARYSLGMTLWHMGHNPEMISGFHEYLKKAGYTPEKLLSAKNLVPPQKLHAILVEPELMSDTQITGEPGKKPEPGKSWVRDGQYLMSMPQDAGPSVDIPLKINKKGFYRIWFQYYANRQCHGLTIVRIYLAGKEEDGPIFQKDEIYDRHEGNPGPAWKDMLVDLNPGNYIIRLSHAIPWWHGAGGYDYRKIDCIYLTEETWAEPPSAEKRALLRETVQPDGIQWNLNFPLEQKDCETWKWWQLRPISWEDASSNPELFALSRKFWQIVMDRLSEKSYPETGLPDYRTPERQVVFNETWNMVANPIRAKRQIEVLTSDISRKPLGYDYVWHDIADNVPGLADATRPETYGNWSYSGGCLFASYGNPVGTVTTEIPVKKPGTYTMWVLSSSTNLSYTAPWFGIVSVDGKRQFVYHHEGKIPSVWMKMGQVVMNKPGSVKVEFTLDNSGFGSTYRRIYTIFLVNNPNIVPQGTVRPPWTMDMYRDRAAKCGAKREDKYLLWLSENPYTPLSQEVWADTKTTGISWPAKPVDGNICRKEVLMAQDTVRAVQVCLRNLTDAPVTLNVKPGILKGKNRSYANAVTWRVVAFAPYAADRQSWTPFFLLHRPTITIPPLNVAGVWLTLDGRKIEPGSYTCPVEFSEIGGLKKTVLLKVQISQVKAEPKNPVLVDGFTLPHEGRAYFDDFVEHGMKVWRGEMSKDEMKKSGIRLLAIYVGSPEDIVRIKNKGLQYEDWFCPILDEPGGKTETELKPFIDIAKMIRAHDQKVRISFNPGEAATLDTFRVLAPYCDFWIPYSLHVFSPYYGNPEKKQIYQKKPWMWYTTPCLWDKSPGLPEGIYSQIRAVPSQNGRCVGTAFFALNYPWRDQWDTAYEHIPDASTMGAVESRHGPVSTRTWEAIREAIQHADLAMMVRERLGAGSFEEIQDDQLRKLIEDGSEEQLILWLEQHSQNKTVHIPASEH